MEASRDIRAICRVAQWQVPIDPTAQNARDALLVGGLCNVKIGLECLVQLIGCDVTVSGLHDVPKHVPEGDGGKWRMPRIGKKRFSPNGCVIHQGAFWRIE